MEVIEKKDCNKYGGKTFIAFIMNVCKKTQKNMLAACNAVVEAESSFFFEK